MSLFFAENKTANSNEGNAQDTTNNVVKQQISTQKNKRTTSEISGADSKTNTISPAANEQIASTNNDQKTNDDNKQAIKPDLNTFSGLSLFFTTTDDAPAQNTDTNTKKIRLVQLIKYQLQL